MLPAPHFRQLDWFHRPEDPVPIIETVGRLHCEIVDEDRKVIAVRIAPDGYVSDILLEHALLQGHWAERAQWAKENQTILRRPPLCTAAPSRLLRPAWH